MPLLAVYSSGFASMEKFTKAMIATLVECGPSATVTSESFWPAHRINFQTLREQSCTQRRQRHAAGLSQEKLGFAARPGA